MKKKKTAEDELFRHLKDNGSMDEIANILRRAQLGELKDGPAPADPAPAEPAPRRPIPEIGWTSFEQTARIVEGKRFVQVHTEFILARKKVRDYVMKHYADDFFAENPEEKKNEYYFGWARVDDTIRKPKNKQLFLVSVGEPDELIIFNSLTAMNRKLQNRISVIKWIIPMMSWD